MKIKIPSRKSSDTVTYKIFQHSAYKQTNNARDNLLIVDFFVTITKCKSINFPWIHIFKRKHRREPPSTHKPRIYGFWKLSIIIAKLFSPFITLPWPNERPTIHTYTHRAGCRGWMGPRPVVNHTNKSAVSNWYPMNYYCYEYIMKIG